MFQLLVLLGIFNTVQMFSIQCKCFQYSANALRFTANHKAKKVGQRKRAKIFFLHISSSYAKIQGETNFHTREFPQSGSKAEDGERKTKKKKREKERKKERAKVGDNNGQATHGARKHAWRTQAAWANLIFYTSYPRVTPLDFLNLNSFINIMTKITL